MHPSILDPYDPPISSSLTPIHYHASLAPTAQKDGRVIGLFDLLSDASGNSKTPSKRSSLKATALIAFTTPSKRPLNEPQIKDQDTPNRNPKSPISASKRNLLSTFLTPSTRHVVESRTPGSGSRSGVSKLRFDETPAFLRRDSQRARNDLDAEGEDNDTMPWSPVRVRTNPAGRGLSALVRGLRELEEEKLDDDLEMLHELEAEEIGRDGDVEIKKPPAPPKLLVADSQTPDMPLGPDGNNNESEDEEALAKEGLGRDGKPLKMWKKKGQKRSTRRVIMRPVTGKWKPEAEWTGGRDTDEKDEVGETQLINNVAPNNEASESEHEFLDSDEDELSNIAGAEKKKRPTKAKASEEKPKKKKMVAATAHANFRALKIRNKQSKGKGGGKFGRRR